VAGLETAIRFPMAMAIALVMQESPSTQILGAGPK